MNLLNFNEAEAMKFFYNNLNYFVIEKNKTDFYSENLSQEVNLFFNKYRKIAFVGKESLYLSNTEQYYVNNYIKIGGFNKKEHIILLEPRTDIIYFYNEKTKILKKQDKLYTFLISFIMKNSTIEFNLKNEK